MLGLVIELLFLSGCFAAGIVGQIPQVDDDNSATVYIARKAGINGCATSFKVQLDDKDFIRIDCGMKTHFKIPADEKIKISSVSTSLFGIPDDFFIEPVEGEVYYFGMDCNFNCCWFDRLSREEYNRIAETCSKDLVINQGNRVKYAQEEASPPGEKTQASDKTTPGRGIKPTMDAEQKTQPSKQATPEQEVKPTMDTAKAVKVSSDRTPQPARKVREYWSWGLGVLVKTEQNTVITKIDDSGYSSARKDLRIGDEIVRIGEENISMENAYNILTKPMPKGADGLVPIVVRRDGNDLPCRIKPNDF